MSRESDGRRGRTSGRGARAALVAVALLVMLPAPGRATVSCGTVVEEQVILDRDLRCDGPGLIVRNPRTVVQLNGHAIVSTRACGAEAFLLQKRAAVTESANRRE